MFSGRIIQSMKTWASFDVAGVARNREVVDEQPDAFLRIDVFEAGALGVGAVEGAVPLLVHGDLAGGHALDGAVAVVHGQRRLLPEQQVEDLLRFLASSVHSSMPR